MKSSIPLLIAAGSLTLTASGFAQTAYVAGFSGLTGGETTAPDVNHAGSQWVSRDFALGPGLTAFDSPSVTGALEFDSAASNLAGAVQNDAYISWTLDIPAYDGSACTLPDTDLFVPQPVDDFDYYISINGAAPTQLNEFYGTALPIDLPSQVGVTNPSALSIDFRVYPIFTGPTSIDISGNVTSASNGSLGGIDYGSTYRARPLDGCYEVTPTPEASSALLAAIAATLGLGLRRRR